MYRTWSHLPNFSSVFTLERWCALIKPPAPTHKPAHTPKHNRWCKNTNMKSYTCHSHISQPSTEAQPIFFSHSDTQVWFKCVSSTQMHTCMHTRMHAHTYAHAYAHMHVHMHAHTHTYADAHTGRASGILFPQLVSGLDVGPCLSVWIGEGYSGNNVGTDLSKTCCLHSHSLTVSHRQPGAQLSSYCTAHNTEHVLNTLMTRLWKSPLSYCTPQLTP